jgi:hypothetical protein
MDFFFKQSQCTKILFFSGHAFFFNKTGMFVYCITDMTATLIKNSHNSMHTKKHYNFQYEQSAVLVKQKYLLVPCFTIIYLL